MSSYSYRTQHPLYVNSPLNVSAEIKFGRGQVYEYRRTSTNLSFDKPEHHHLSRPYNENTIFAVGVSAFKREDIYDLIVFLVQNGSRDFFFHIVDETRFTRNMSAALKIHDYLFSNKTTFYLVIDGKKYDYVKDFYSYLRQMFVESEASSVEKSRISKLAYKRKKDLKQIKKDLKDHFIGMMFVLSGGLQGAIHIQQSIDIIGLSVPKLKMWYKENQKIIKRLKKIKEYTYVKCNYTGDYFICPAKYFGRKDLSVTYVGLGPSDMRKCFTNYFNMNYLCFKKEDIEVKESEMNLEAGPADANPSQLSENDKEWIVEVYTEKHKRGEITISELTEKLRKLFSS